MDERMEHEAGRQPVKEIEIAERPGAGKTLFLPVNQPVRQEEKRENRMAKLNAKLAKQVDSVVDGFAPIPAGVYHAVLMKVDTDRSGPKGPYWSWEFSVIDPEEFKGRKLWNNTTLMEGAQFGLKQTFTAFGVGVDADTDDLCGKVVKLQVGVRIIENGARAGEEANSINRVLPADEGIKADTSDDTPHPDDVFA